jgi:hypothetical protein
MSMSLWPCCSAMGRGGPTRPQTLVWPPPLKVPPLAISSLPCPHHRSSWWAPPPDVQDLRQEWCHVWLQWTLRSLASLTPLSPWWWGLRPSVTPAQVLEHLSRFYHVENHEVSVRRNRYGCFLVNFSAAGSSIEFCMQDTLKELI